MLPEEWDASFNKALPILIDGDYVPDHQLPAIRRVLKAAALAMRHSTTMQETQTRIPLPPLHPTTVPELSLTFSLGVGAL